MIGKQCNTCGYRTECFKNRWVITFDTDGETCDHYLKWIDQIGGFSGSLRNLKKALQKIGNVVREEMIACLQGGGDRKMFKKLKNKIDVTGKLVMQVRTAHKYVKLYEKIVDALKETIDGYRIKISQGELVYVVRCRECKHYRSEDKTCFIGLGLMPPSGYCQLGERKE